MSAKYYVTLSIILSIPKKKQCYIFLFKIDFFKKKLICHKCELFQENNISKDLKHRKKFISKSWNCLEEIWVDRKQKKNHCERWTFVVYKYFMKMMYMDVYTLPLYGYKLYSTNTISVYSYTY